MLALGLVGVGLALSIVLALVLLQADERRQARVALRALADYELENVREKELLVPLRERALMPLLARLTELGRRFTPHGYVDKVRLKLTAAGTGDKVALDRFLAVRAITAALSPLAALIAWNVAPMGGMGRLLLTGVVAVGLVAGPDSVLDRKVEDRRYEIQRKLPDVMDILVISVEAGLGFEQAIERTVSAVPGPLSDEFARMLGELRAGATRADALRGLEGRTQVPELRSFVLAILQADAFGVSIGRVLRAQADEIRIKRRQLAQERAAKAPVKMLIPMVFCIFPALFVVVLGPAAINIANNL